MSSGAETAAATEASAPVEPRPPGPDAWLVVIDAQVAFAHPSESPWGSPMFEDIVDPVRRLCEAFGERVVFTRYEPLRHPRGSWVPYFEQWSFAQQPGDHRLWQVVDELAPLAGRVVTEHTFGKYGPGLLDVVGSRYPELVVAGVATDCCVVSTVLPAADGGGTVWVVDDACAGSTPENHRKALDVMGLYAPQVWVTDTESVIASR